MPRKSQKRTHGKDSWLGSIVVQRPVPRRTWNLDRASFNRELGCALAALRFYFRRNGITSAADLEA